MKFAWTSLFVLAVLCAISGLAGSAGVGISTAPDAVEPTPSVDSKHFYQYKPGSPLILPLPYRDWEFQIDTVSVYVASGTTFLSDDFKTTFNKFGDVLSGTAGVSSPFK